MALTSITPSMLTSGSSGIDVNTIVSQLMQIEQQPLNSLKQKEVAYQAKISAYAALLSSMQGLNTAISALNNSTISMTASASDSSFFTATASSSAAAGTNNIQINNIASAQSLYSLRYGSQTGTVADLSGVATQYLRLQVGSSSPKVITINSSNNTLSGIRDAINAANVGVTASVLKESGNFLIDGTNNTIIFNDGTANRTATIASGTYSGTDLATAIQTAMNSAIGTTNTFTVDYNSTSSSRFTIKNSAGPAVTILWGNTGTTAQQMLGFSPVNSASLAAGSGVTATDTVDGSYKLTLSVSSTGSAGRVIMKADETGGGYTETGVNADKLGLSALAFNATYNATTGAVTGGITNLTQSQTALDAKLKINGIEVTRAGNTISDLITGVTLNLLKGDSYTASLTLSVSKNSGSLSSQLSSLVTAYNSTMSAITGLRGNQNQAGVLQGDSTVSTLQNMLRSMTTAKYGSNNVDNTLSYLGVTHDKNGVLSFDSSKLSSAFSADAANVINIVNKMASSVGASMNNYINTMIPARQNGYQQTLKDILKSEDNISASLPLKEAALRQQYSALDQMVSRLQGVSNYLTLQTTTYSKTIGG